MTMHRIFFGDEVITECFMTERFSAPNSCGETQFCGNSDFKALNLKENHALQV